LREYIKNGISKEKRIFKGANNKKLVTHEICLGPNAKINKVELIVYSVRQVRVDVAKLIIPDQM
jgi:hypothetical protein